MEVGREMGGGGLRFHVSHLHSETLVKTLDIEVQRSFLGVEHRDVLGG